MNTLAQNKILRLDTKGVAQVMTVGRALPAGSFLLKYEINSSTEPFKVAFSAPKKLFKTAILRNKAKRRARSSLQALIKAQKGLKMLKNGSTGAFILRTSILTDEITSISREMEQVLKKSGILYQLN